MHYGIALGGRLTEIGTQAQAAERAGFESVWVAETVNSAFVAATAAVEATTTVTVGTAVALAFPRSPTITAMTAWDLDELSGGRFALGLGSQVKGVLERRFSVAFEPPAPKLREYAEVLRAVWAANRGEQAVHEGRFYTVTMTGFHGAPDPGRRDVPIHFAAVGEVMCAVAGEVADGVLAHPLASPRYIAEVMRPAVAAGARRAGRDPGSCVVTASPMVAIADDPDRARRAAKLQIAFYATTRSYAAILALHGRADRIAELRTAFNAGDQDRMVELVDDELCDAIAAAGRADEVRDRLRDWEDVADRVVVGGPWYGVDAGEKAENERAILETFAREPAAHETREER